MAYGPSYVYTPQSKPRTGVARARPVTPVRVVSAPRNVGVRPRNQVMRIRYGGTGTDALGILPAIAAAALPSVKELLGKALTSVAGIVDPGVKRDANRKARANLWIGLANQGSITAARRVLGGSKVQYTQKERQYYIDGWNSLLKTKPLLAQQAQTLGGLGIPEPGSDVAPPDIPAEDITALQREIDAYNAATAAGVTSAAALPAPGATKALPASTAGINPLIALGIGGALLKAVL